MSKKKGKGYKKPKFGKSPNIRKEPRLTQYKSGKDKIYFSFRKFDASRKWEASSETVDFWKLGQKLYYYEAKTWGQLMGERRKDHYVPFANLDARCQDALFDLKMEIYDGLFSLNISKLQRLWGVRADDHFLVLWWDPDHNVYPVKKRNK